MPVNEAITDSVTQVNTKVVGETPAMAMGNLLMSTSQALGISAHNATAAQQRGKSLCRPPPFRALTRLCRLVALW